MAAAPCRVVAAERGRAMSGGGGRTRPRHVGRWRPNAAAPCRSVAAERGRAMSGGGGRTRPRHVGRWRPNAAAPCRAVAAERGRVMSGGGGGRMRPRYVGQWRPRHVGRWRPRAAAPCRVALMGHGTTLTENRHIVANRTDSGGTVPTIFLLYRRPAPMRFCTDLVARVRSSMVAEKGIPACRAPVARLSPACRAPVARPSRACRLHG